MRITVVACCCKGVRTRRKVRAPAVSLYAVLWVPTCRASYTALPLTQKLPDATRSPAHLRTRSDSPVSRDSSTSIHPLPTRRPSTTIWSPGRTTSKSPTTRALGSTGCSWPARSTVAVGRVSRAMRSRARLARISWTIPTTRLKEITDTVVMASSGRPSRTRTPLSANRILLIRVRMFSRRIWP